MLTLDYQDPEDFNQSAFALSFTHDLWATTWENRDLIALSIRSFAILKFYKELNAEVIDALNFSEVDEGSLTWRQQERMDLERNLVTSTLLELDFIKWVLYGQILLNTQLESQIKDVSWRHNEIESEMEATL